MVFTISGTSVGDSTGSSGGGNGASGGANGASGGANGGPEVATKRASPVAMGMTFLPILRPEIINTP